MPLAQAESGRCQCALSASGSLPLPSQLVAKRCLGPPYAVGGSSKLLADDQYAALFEFTHALSDSPILVYPQADHSTPWPPTQMFQPVEATQKTASPICCHRYPRHPAGASRAGPSLRNCLRRLPSVGPDSTRLVPKRRFLSSWQCRLANVMALSGLTDGWRRVFRAPDRAACGRRRYGSRRVSCHFSAI